jgi:hypothetical protein
MHYLPGDQRPWTIKIRPLPGRIWVCNARENRSRSCGQRTPSSSGAWIRTKDLRVMSEKPVFTTFDHQARLFSRPDEEWFLQVR